MPYRECKLTHILKPALGGNTRTAMICAVTPAEMHYNETVSTLEFAARAKKVVNSAHINEVKESKVSMKEYEKVRHMSIHASAKCSSPPSQLALSSDECVRVRKVRQQIKELESANKLKDVRYSELLQMVEGMSEGRFFCFQCQV